MATGNPYFSQGYKTAIKYIHVVMKRITEFDGLFCGCLTCFWLILVDH